MYLIHQNIPLLHLHISKLIRLKTLIKLLIFNTGQCTYIIFSYNIINYNKFIFQVKFVFCIFRNKITIRISVCVICV